MTTHENEPDTVSAVDRRRRLAALGIAVVCVLAVIIGALLAVRAATSGDGPKSDNELVEEQVRGYLTDMSNADVRGASERMCQALGPVVSGGAYTPRVPSGDGGTRNAQIVVGDVTINDDTATVDAELRYGSVTTQMPMTLRQESDGWCITDVE